MGLRANRWAVFAVGLVAQLTFSATFLGLPAASFLLRENLGLTTTGLALVLGGASLAVVLSEFPWGLMADRFGERRVLLIGVVGSACALAGAAAAASTPHPSALILAVLLFAAAGLGGAVTGPSGSAILGWFGARAHGTLLSFRVAAVPAGGALGTVVYSWLLTSFGAGTAFACFAGAAVVCSLLITAFVFDPPAVPVAVSASGSRSTPRAVARIIVWRIALSGVLLDVSQFLVLTFGTTMLTVLYGFPPAAGIAAVALMQLAGGLLRVVVGAGTDFVPWLSRAAVVRAAAGTQVVCLLAFASHGSGPGLAMTTLLVAGTSSCAWQGAHYAQMATAAGPGQAGTALGLNNAATSFGAFLPQVVGGGLAVAVGWSPTVLILGVVPAAVAALLFPALTRDAE